MPAFVISHPELQVFLGTADDALIWSGIDPLGQNVAVTFTTAQEAHDFLAELPGPLPGCVVAEVVADVFHGGRVFASIAAIEAAGLRGWDLNVKPSLHTASTREEN